MAMGDWGSMPGQCRLSLYSSLLRAQVCRLQRPEGRSAELKVELFLHGAVHNTAYEQPQLSFCTTNLHVLFIHYALFVPFAA
jgi:hypothetical protein